MVDICKLSTADEQKILSSIILSSPPGEGYLVSLMKSLIVVEFKTASSGGSILRQNSMATKLIGGYLKEMGSDYLFHFVSPITQQVIQDKQLVISFSPQPDQTQSEIDSQVQSSKENTEHYLDLFLDSIFSKESLQALPPSICLLSNFVLTLSGPYQDSLSSPTALVGGLLFLRFICTALFGSQTINTTMPFIPTSPDTCSISKQTQKNLLVIAKVLQSLSNGAELGIKEEKMKFMNDYVNRRQEEMNSFLRAVCERGATILIEDGTDYTFLTKWNSCDDTVRFISDLHQLWQIVSREKEQLIEEWNSRINELSSDQKYETTEDISTTTAEINLWREKVAFIQSLPRLQFHLDSPVSLPLHAHILSLLKCRYSVDLSESTLPSLRSLLLLTSFSHTSQPSSEFLYSTSPFPLFSQATQDLSTLLTPPPPPTENLKPSFLSNLDSNSASGTTSLNSKIAHRMLATISHKQRTSLESSRFIQHLSSTDITTLTCLFTPARLLPYVDSLSPKDISLFLIRFFLSYTTPITKNITLVVDLSSSTYPSQYPAPVDSCLTPTSTDLVKLFIAVSFALSFWCTTKTSIEHTGGLRTLVHAQSSSLTDDKKTQQTRDKMKVTPEVFKVGKTLNSSAIVWSAPQPEKTEQTVSPLIKGKDIKDDRKSDEKPKKDWKRIGLSNLRITLNEDPVLEAKVEPDTRPVPPPDRKLPPLPPPPILDSDFNVRKIEKSKETMHASSDSFDTSNPVADSPNSTTIRHTSLQVSPNPTHFTFTPSSAHISLTSRQSESIRLRTHLMSVAEQNEGRECDLETVLRRKNWLKTGFGSDEFVSHSNSPTTRLSDANSMQNEHLSFFPSSISNRMLTSYSKALNSISMGSVLPQYVVPNEDWVKLDSEEVEGEERKEVEGENTTHVVSEMGEVKVVGPTQFTPTSLLFFSTLFPKLQFQTHSSIATLSNDKHIKPARSLSTITEQTRLADLLQRGAFVVHNSSFPHSTRPSAQSSPNSLPFPSPPPSPRHPKQIYQLCSLSAGLTCRRGPSAWQLSEESSVLFEANGLLFVDEGKMRELFSFSSIRRILPTKRSTDDDTRVWISRKDDGDEETTTPAFALSDSVINIIHKPEPTDKADVTTTSVGSVLIVSPLRASSTAADSPPLPSPSLHSNLSETDSSSALHNRILVQFSSSDDKKSFLTRLTRQRIDSSLKSPQKECHLLKLPSQFESTTNEDNTTFTAKHVVVRFLDSSLLFIQHERKWKEIQYILIESVTCRKLATLINDTGSEKTQFWFNIVTLKEKNGKITNFICEAEYIDHLRKRGLFDGKMKVDRCLLSQPDLAQNCKEMEVEESAEGFVEREANLPHFNEPHKLNERLVAFHDFPPYRVMGDCSF
ncbi:hypothetical protein BLNAU_21890 [Blattamonas nauphoetae]|uniref:Ras-GAP domain-containing protein n=1 Tax=Blattamonas nauphoetae TaxID=2049346 RepID=A0ABQ9WYX3_9EUKA|nr:hypothetical protein BLNAU_21890 [Blattamonas nauphoetae]